MYNTILSQIVPTGISHNHPSFGQKYPLVDILSITTGYKLADNLKGAYKLLGDMSGIDDFESNVSGLLESTAFVTNNCREKLFAQFPNLNYIDTRGISPKTVDEWLAKQERIFGKELDIKI